LAKGKNYTPDDLYEHYVSFGSDPFIVALDPICRSGGEGGSNFAPVSPTSVTLFKAVLRSLRKYQTTNATTNGHANPLTKLTIAVMNDAFHSGLGA
jgi:hypothetical protein